MKVMIPKTYTCVSEDRTGLFDDIHTVPISISQSSDPKPLMDILVKHRSVIMMKHKIQKNMVTAKRMRHWPSNVLEAIVCRWRSQKEERAEKTTTHQDQKPYLDCVERPILNGEQV